MAWWKILLIIASGAALIAVVVLAAVTVVLRSLLAKSGLARLVQLYAAAAPWTASLAPRQTVVIGRLRLRRCVTVGASPEGLYLSVRIAWHRPPPLLIPWYAVEGIEQTRLGTEKAVRLSIRKPEVASVALPWEWSTAVSEYLSRSMGTV